MKLQKDEKLLLKIKGSNKFVLKHLSEQFIILGIYLLFHLFFIVVLKMDTLSVDTLYFLLSWDGIILIYDIFNMTALSNQTYYITNQRVILNHFFKEYVLDKNNITYYKDFSVQLSRKKDLFHVSFIIENKHLFLFKRASYTMFGISQSDVEKIDKVMHYILADDLDKIIV